MSELFLLVCLILHDILFRKMKSDKQVQELSVEFYRFQFTIYNWIKNFEKGFKHGKEAVPSRVETIVRLND